MQGEHPQPEPTGDLANATEKYVTISVDDGHPTDLRTVDLLQQYGLNATFYIPGANAERTVMEPCQIREIDRLFEVGSHTLNHLRLTWISEERAWREIVMARRPPKTCWAMKSSRSATRVGSLTAVSQGK